MTYQFKSLQELVRALAVALLTWVGALNFAGLSVDNWKPWAIAAGAGAGQAVLAALLAWLSPTGTFSKS